MKTRLLFAFAGLAISLTLPIFGQQKDVADPQTTQKIDAMRKAFAEAENNHDSAAIAAFFTRDAVFVTDGGPITGRQAIQKWWTELFQGWHPENCIGKVDRNAYHLTAGNELWATGEYNEIGQGKNGEPIPVKTHWLCIYVREGDDWKIRLNAWNVTPDSVLIINRSFASQPAVRPAPIVSPSGQ